MRKVEATVMYDEVFIQDVETQEPVGQFKWKSPINDDDYPDVEDRVRQICEIEDWELTNFG